MKNFIEKINRTILCAGSVSKNVVDSIIEISDDFNVKLLIISSRNQIDTLDFNGGYVENWSTENFSKYVKKKSKKNNIILCRDHGGPWQNNYETENKFNLKQTISSCKNSFKNDIKNDFQIIHIDVSAHQLQINDLEKILDQTFELYEYCHIQAQLYKKKIYFEVGSENQEIGYENIQSFEEYVTRLMSGCSKLNLPTPLFIVANTGSKVVEFENLANSKINENKLSFYNDNKMNKIFQLSKKYNFFIKEHNVDYLDNNLINLHSHSNIHAANIAPEFGVEETKTFIEMLSTANMDIEKKEFLTLCYNSNKWTKWIKNKTKLSKFEKSILVGHYNFNNPQVKVIKKKLAHYLKNKNINLDFELKERIKKTIFKYLNGFKLIN